MDLASSTAAELLGIVHLDHLGREIRHVAGAEFLDGVHAGGLEQFGELRADAFDTVEVDHVGPLEDAAVLDAGLRLEFLALLGGLAGREKPVGVGDARGAELLAVGGADALNVFDLVIGHAFLLRLCP